MTWTFHYSFLMEDAGESDAIQYEAEITPAENEAIERAIEEERSLKEDAALQGLIWRTYDAIHDCLLRELTEQGDDYTLQCLANNADPFDYAYTLQVEISDPAVAETKGTGSWF